MLENQDLPNRLSALRGKHEYCKAQKADQEAKKAKYMAELKALGFSSVDELKASVEKSRVLIKEMEAKLEESLANAEEEAKLLEDRLSGKVSAPWTPPPSPLRDILLTNEDEL